MTDDQDVEEMRALAQTQALLGDTGIMFNNFIASYPLCCPSRASFLTGQYNTNNGVLGNPSVSAPLPPAEAAPSGDGASAESEADFLPAENGSLAVALSAAGYYTGLLGKYLNGYGLTSSGNSSRNRIPPGWSDWRASFEPYDNDYWRTHMNINGSIVNYTGQFQTDVYADQAVDMIDQASAGGQPFYLQIGFSAPHGGTGPGKMFADRHAGEFSHETAPRTPSFNESDTTDKPGFLQRFYPRLTATRQSDLDARYRRELRSLLSVDEAVAGILARLDETGELDNTILIFTSDNGLFHGQHRIYGGKYVPYEPALHMPLLISGPVVATALRGSTNDQLVANIDIAPTILDFAEVPPRRRPDGQSLRPLLEQEGVDWSTPSTPWSPARSRSRPVLLLGIGQPQSTRYPGVTYSGVRSSDGWVYVKWESAGRAEELYNLNTDPEQLTNLAHDPAFRPDRNRLERQRQLLLHCRGRSCQVPPLGYLDLPPQGTTSWFPAARWADGQALGAAYRDGTFRPTNPIRRDELVNWLWRYSGAPTDAPDSGLADVPAYIAAAVDWAVAAGVLHGFGDHTFRPGQPVTRGTFASWLWSLAGQPPVPTDDLPPDVSPNSAAAGAIAWLLDDPAGPAGPIAFTSPDGTFRPGEFLTRSRAVVFLERYDERSS